MLQTASQTPNRDIQSVSFVGKQAVERTGTRKTNMENRDRLTNEVGQLETMGSGRNLMVGKRFYAWSRTQGYSGEYGGGSGRVIS